MTSSTRRSRIRSKTYHKSKEELKKIRKKSPESSRKRWLDRKKKMYKIIKDNKEENQRRRSQSSE